MIQRGHDCKFSFCKEDFDRWMGIIGLIPEGMRCPSVGRYDHTKGYIFDVEMNRWNFRWEEYDENTAEAAQRRGSASVVAQVEKGTHNSQTLVGVKSQLRNGTHPSLTKRKCPYCGEDFQTASINRHIRAKHLEELTCPMF